MQPRGLDVGDIGFDVFGDDSDHEYLNIGLKDDKYALGSVCGDHNLDEFSDGDCGNDELLVRAMDRYEARVAMTSSSSLQTSNNPSVAPPLLLSASATHFQPSHGSPARRQGLHQPSLLQFVTKGNGITPAIDSASPAIAVSGPTTHSRHPYFAAPQQDRDQPLAAIGLQEETPDGPSRPSPVIDSIILQQHAQSHHPFDCKTVTSWLYPTNYPVRDYQFNITQRALFLNTLVSLPTGLGKTLIAAVVMFNFHRWFPEGKIIFVAPTRPLVMQQVEACYQVVGIPPEDTATFVGTTVLPFEREAIWRSKTVFFATPQTVLNDIQRGACPVKQVVCLVVDEAHRAAGSYAYTVIVREIMQIHRNFRVLALSATPGSTKQKIDDVINNLAISRIEVRSEDSIDIARFMHRKSIEIIAVRLTGLIATILQTLTTIMQPMLDQLHRANIIATTDPSSITVFSLNQRRIKFNAHCNATPQKMTLNGTVTTLLKFIRMYEVLTMHSLREFYHLLKTLAVEVTNGSMQRPPKQLITILRGKNYINLVTRLDAIFVTPITMPISKVIEKDNSQLHPKQHELERVLLTHFAEAEETKRRKQTTAQVETATDTKVIIFAHYRFIVDEIKELLSKHEPLIRSVAFIGQGKGQKTGDMGMNQREQMTVLNKFKQGIYNTLIATSIGEEGLDIGEVDMIVCYDSSNSPIQMLQRLGRTGRKRSGKVFLLLTADKEEGKYRRSQESYKSLQDAIRQQDRHFNLYKESSRMVPWVPGARPVCIKMPFHIRRLDERHLRAFGTAALMGIRDKQKFGLTVDIVETGPFLGNERLIEYMSTYQLTEYDLEQLKARPGTSLARNPNLAPAPAVGHWPIILSLTQHLNWQMSNSGMNIKTHRIGHSRRTEQFLNILKHSASLKQLELVDIEQRFTVPNNNDIRYLAKKHPLKVLSVRRTRRITDESNVNSEDNDVVPLQEITIPVCHDAQVNQERSRLFPTTASGIFMASSFEFDDNDSDDLPELGMVQPDVPMAISTFRQQQTTRSQSSRFVNPVEMLESNVRTVPDKASIVEDKWRNGPTPHNDRALVHSELKKDEMTNSISQDYISPMLEESPFIPSKYDENQHTDEITATFQTNNCPSDDFWNENPLPFDLPWQKTSTKVNDNCRNIDAPCLIKSTFPHIHFNHKSTMVPTSATSKEVASAVKQLPKPSLIVRKSCQTSDDDQTAIVAENLRPTMLSPVIMGEQTRLLKPWSQSTPRALATSTKTFEHSWETSPFAWSTAASTTTVSSSLLMSAKKDTPTLAHVLPSYSAELAISPLADKSRACIQTVQRIRPEKVSNLVTSNAFFLPAHSRSVSPSPHKITSSQAFPSSSSSHSQLIFCKPMRWKSKQLLAQENSLLIESDSASLCQVEPSTPISVRKHILSESSTTDEERSVEAKSKQKRRRLLFPHNQYLDVQAEVSGEESADEDDELLNESQGSLVEFLDEREHDQLTQHVSPNTSTRAEINMAAIYRQALESPNATPDFLRRGRRLLAKPDQASPIQNRRTNHLLMSSSPHGDFVAPQSMGEDDQYDSEDSFLVSDNENDSFAHEIAQATQTLEMADLYIERDRARKKKKRAPALSVIYSQNIDHTVSPLSRYQSSKKSQVETEVKIGVDENETPQFAKPLPRNTRVIVSSTP